MTCRVSLLILFTTILIGSCSSKEQVQKAIYDGLKAREQILDQSPEPIPKEYPSYHDYQLEREKLLKEENDKK